MISGLSLPTHLIKRWVKQGGLIFFFSILKCRETLSRGVHFFHLKDFGVESIILDLIIFHIAPHSKQIQYNQTIYQ